VRNLLKTANVTLFTTNPSIRMTLLTQSQPGDLMNEKGRSETVQKAYQLGYEYEGKYGACSQCTLLAIMDAMDKRDSKVFQASFGFAGGIASLSKTCGALSAGIMAISMEYGRELGNLTTQSEDDRQKCMQMVRDLHDQFTQEYGDIQCSSVHQQIFGRTFDQWDKNEFQEFLRLGGHLDKCTAVVGNVARWTVEIILDNSQDELTRQLDING
jgi:C_GCAxxG_C_C family probable redox protein